jgi:hypothetical protein
MLHMFLFKPNILIIKDHEVLRSQKNEWKVYKELSKTVETGFDEFWKYNFFIYDKRCFVAIYLFVLIVNNI